MRKILYISMCMPFDKVCHAGGKTFNYYINSFADNKDNEITLIAKVLPDEEKYISTVHPHIRVLWVSTPKARLKKFSSYLKSLNSKLNPWYKYGNTLSKDIYDKIEKKMKLLREENYIPHLIILEWTSILLFIDCIKKYFPNAKYIASEHDVSFLGYQRRMERGILHRRNRIAYYNMKKRELAAIKKCNLVVTHNNKDKELLINNGIDTSILDVITPYYDKFLINNRQPNKRDILFYGAMNRMENHTAAVWFIKNVLPLLNNYDIRFIIIGNKPSKELQNLAGDNIIVTGYVENPASYFAHAMCLVAPLLYGAGVKVKIIEALSSGIPVLTNNIGIEGIEAEDKVNYFHCTTPEEYRNVICDLIEEKINTEKISKNAKKLISHRYDLKKSFDNYSRRIYALID